MVSEDVMMDVTGATWWGGRMRSGVRPESSREAPRASAGGGTPRKTTGPRARPGLVALRRYTKQSLRGGRVHGARRRAPLSLLCGLLLVQGLTVCPGMAEAEVSSGSSNRLQSGEINQGGPGASSAGSGRKQQVNIGGGFSQTKLSSASFRVSAGFLAATFASSATATPPPAELDITVLTALTTGIGGVAISAETWQLDKDPHFSWEEPAAGLSLAGYSYALGGEPNDEVDTTSTSWDVAADPIGALTDGVHTFSVKAIGTSGLSGEVISFTIWVDTTAPTISLYSPSAGSLLNTLTPGISATITDIGSGVTSTGITLLVNSSTTSVNYASETGAMTATGSGGIHEGLNSIELRVSDELGNALTPLVWSFTVDATPPTGTVVINGDAGTTTSVYVTLNLTASDVVSGVSGMLISNDPVIGFVQEPYTSTRELWRLNAVSGSQSVYVKFTDVAGNISTPAVSDSIELALIAPETILLMGPAGVTPAQTAEFTFSCAGEGCVFSYSFDTEGWSDWSSATSADVLGLSYGNHYFRVKAARESNGTPGIQLDEEDPTPADRNWIVNLDLPVTIVPYGAPIRFWRLD